LGLGLIGVLVSLSS